MRLFLILLLISPQILAEPLLIEGASVVDVTGKGHHKAMDVVVRDGRIAALGSDLKAPDGARVIDASGGFLIPGLAEMHAHIPPTTQPQGVRDTLTLYLVNGITTVRGMLGEPGHLRLRQQQLDGRLDAPRIYAASPSLNGNSVRSAEHARELVKTHHEAGYDLLKIHPGLSLEEYQAMASEARALGMPFAGHVPAEVGFWRAVGAGQASIDHMDGYVEALTPVAELKALPPSFFNYLAAPKARAAQIPLLLQALKDKNVWTVPTESLMVRYAGVESAEALLQRPSMQYVSPNQRRDWARRLESTLNDDRFDPAAARAFLDLRRRLIVAIARSEPGLLLGSDAPQTFQVPGFSMHEELAIYVEAGLTPAEALKTGSLNVARYLGVAAHRGRIAVGQDADLVLLRANPLEDIAHSREIAGVMVAGRWYDHDWIAAELAAIADRHGQGVTGN